MTITSSVKNVSTADVAGVSSDDVDGHHGIE